MRTTVIIPDKLMKKVRLEAIERGNLKEVSKIICEAIEEYLVKRSQKNNKK